ncbi:MULTISPECIES: TIGR01212 family radical SAM protein [Thermodesulfovibrio]|uniref:TIGR01212 family radical SAM protein n=1 Tax=Thermodesulfovibrio yellowstonii TaxID=28262 RepID=A0A9W6LKA1_9BACT|nr:MULTISPECIES: TIGR01212 family radical SAM protein [Thermodesulfovibrio]GLI52610.1 TIGR01212 family radical SAM protein [Thermodesulfovibrio islandicus]
MMNRYYSFGEYLKEIFGKKVYKVNVDAGFTCPNRDGTLGTTGCIYCNNDSFRPSSCAPSKPLIDQIKNGIGYLKARYKAKAFLVYFQPYTNTYASVDHLEKLYKEALSHPEVVGLAIGTRPDCVDDEKLELLQMLSKTHMIIVEYGMQSIYEKSLAYIMRGHDYSTFLKAVYKTHERGILVGAHIIVGIPTETREESLAMADEINRHPIKFLKIHQLQVVKDTVLARIYEREPFKVFEYEEYLDFVVDFLERLSPDIVIQRLFATSPDEILIAPKWNRSKQQILNDINKRLEERNARQGSKCSFNRHRALCC